MRQGKPHSSKLSKSRSGVVEDAARNQHVRVGVAMLIAPPPPPLIRASRTAMEPANASRSNAASVLCSAPVQFSQSLRTRTPQGKIRYPDRWPLFVQFSPLPLVRTPLSSMRYSRASWSPLGHLPRALVCLAGGVRSYARL